MIYTDRVFGKTEISGPPILELVTTKAFQRLQGVHQHDAVSYFFHEEKVTRFEHSLGVYLTLKRLGRPLVEQVAGLLHDVSVLAFNHAFDFAQCLKQESPREHRSLHEKFHREVILNSEIPDVLKRHQVPLEEVIEFEKFPLVDKEIPALCADRFDYTLRDGNLVGLIKKGEARRILGNITIIDGELGFKNFDTAKTFAEKYLAMDDNLWAHPRSVYAYLTFAEAIKQALESEILDERVFLSLENKDVIETMEEKGNAKIKSLIRMLRRGFDVTEDQDKFEFFFQPKPRNVDPLFSGESGPKRLSEADEEFKRHRKAHIERLENGLHLRAHASTS